MTKSCEPNGKPCKHYGQFPDYTPCRWCRRNPNEDDYYKEVKKK